MKIAVCFSTQLRTGVLTYKNIKNYLGEMYDSCTFFAHLWNTNTRKEYTNLGKNVLPKTIEVSNDEIQYWKSLYPIRSLLVESYSKIADEHNKNNYYFDPIYYSFYKSLELMDDFVNTNKINFDLVVKLRPDIILNPHRRFSKEMLFNYINSSPNTFFVETLSPNYKNEHWMNDVYWVGTPSIMNLAKQFYLEQREYQNSVAMLSKKDHHTFLNYLKKNQINLLGIGNSYGCHKLECAKYDTLSEYDLCFDCERYYFTNEKTNNSY